MKLLTKDLENKFKKVGRDEETPLENKVVITKFFDPTGAGTWYATEYDPESKTFFGFVTLGFGPGNDEWGYFSLNELESVKGRFGLGIERDKFFSPTKFSELNIN